MAYPTSYPWPVPANDPSRAGALAGRKYFPRQCTRYAIYPVHRREMDAYRPDHEAGVFWFITDAETPDSYGHASIVGIASSEAAIFARLRTLYVDREEA